MGDHAEFQDTACTAGCPLMVGNVLQFAVTKLKYKPLQVVAGWGPARSIHPSPVLSCEVVLVQLKIYQPMPQRRQNFYVCRKEGSYRASAVWVPAKLLTAFLYAAPDTENRDDRLNLVTVARSGM